MSRSPTITSETWGIIICDIHGNIIGTNPGFLKLLKYNEEDLQGKTFLQITSSGSLLESLSNFSKLVSRNLNAYKITKEYVNSRGTPVPVNVSVSYTNISAKNKDRKIIGFVEESRNKYLSDNFIAFSINNAPIGISFLENDLVVYANNYARKLLGACIGEKIRVMEEQEKSNSEWKKRGENGNFFIPAKLVSPNGQTIPIKMVRHQQTMTPKKKVSILYFFDTFKEKLKDTIEVKRIQKLKEMQKNLNDYLSNYDLDVSAHEIYLDDYNLTHREKSVVFNFIEGNSTKEMAYTLGIAEITVRKNLSRIYAKFGVSGKEELWSFLYEKVIKSSR